MIIEFALLNIVFLCNFSLFIYFKQYRTSIFIWFFCYFILFITPAYYIESAGESYKFYTEYGVSKYYMLSFTYGLIFFAFLIAKSQCPAKIIVHGLSKNRQVSEYTVLYILFIFVSVSLYVAFYFTKMPFYSVIIGESYIRPDTAHYGIQYYFSFSILMDVICPSLFFLIYDKIKNKLFEIAIITLLSFFLIVGGSKGTLIYFFIFYWFSVLRLKVSKGLITLTIFSFFIYFFLKDMSFNNLGELFNGMASPIRRFFVTQGIAIPIRFDMDNFNLFNDVPYQDIKFAVFKYVYGYEPGSMPIFFTPDVIIKYGSPAGLITLIAFFIILYFISRFIDTSSSYFYHWTFYIISFSILMSGLSEANIYRLTAGLINVFIVYITSKKITHFD